MEDNAIRIVDSSSNLYNAVKISASNVERTQRISNRLLGRLINRRLYQRRMSIQPRQDDETVSQTRFQVKSRKECPRTNSINHFSRVTNRFGINAVTCSERKEEECHRDPKLLKARQCTPRKLAGLKGKLIALKDAVIPFRLYTRKTNKFHCHCLSLSNGDWDQSFVIPQDVKSEVSNWYSMIHSQVPHSTTMEVGDYTTFQSHVKSIINTQKPGTTELFMSSWQQSTLKVYDSNYSRFFSFCLKNSLDLSNITLVVFMDYLTYLFKLKPPLAYSTINSHRSMLNQLLFLKNQTDIAHAPFITRIITGIHKLRPSSAKYNEIWGANLVFRYLSTINIYPTWSNGLSMLSKLLMTQSKVLLSMPKNKEIQRALNI
ncbi:hypothetical protein ACTFIU_009057 [Dictyostelium citrinum]